MKQVNAIVRPDKVPEIRAALKKAGCYHGIMITDIIGQGTQEGVIQSWRGEKYKLDLIPKVKIDVVVKDSEVDDVIKVIVDSSRTGEIGDGKIFVYDVLRVIRIRTGEEGESAI